MSLPYYNESYGFGAEGVLNYVNTLTDGWFVNLFILFIFIAVTFVLSKSEWRMSNGLAFSFFLCLLTALIFGQFTYVNPAILFISIVGLAICVMAGLVGKNR